MVAAAAMPVSAMAVPTVLEAPEQQTVEILADGSARVDGASFGIIGFERLAKGTARASEGAPEGYRLPISDSAGLVVVRAPGEVLLHVDREVAATFDLEDPSGAGLSALWSMACALDEAGSMGGALLSEGEVPLRLVTDSECVSGVFRYRFDARGDDGARYVTVTLANAEEGEAGLDAARAAGVDLGDGVLWCDFAQVVDAGNMGAKDDPGVVGEVLAFFSSIDYRPFWVSLKTSGLALAISFALGLFAAWRAMGTSSRLKGVLDGAAPHGLRLFAAHAVRAIHGRGPLAHSARHHDRLHVGGGGHFGHRGELPARVPHGSRRIRVARRAHDRRRPHARLV